MEDISIAVESPPQVETQPAPGGHQSFNFRNPGHSIRDGIRRLESAHEAFASRMERTLTDSFRISIKLKLKGIEQSTFDRYLAELPSVGVLSKLSLAPFPGVGMFEMSSNVGLAFVEAMLGGAADTVLERKLTVLERKLLQGVAEDSIQALTGALTPLGLSVAVDNWEADPQFMEPESGDLVILVRYAISFGDDGRERDRLVIVYPLEALQALAEGKLDGDGSNAGPAWVGDLMSDVPVRFSVRLRSSRVAFSDLSELQPGDVLRLDHAIDDPVVGLVGPLPLLTGRLGMNKHKLALEIQDWIDHE